MHLLSFTNKGLHRLTKMGRGLESGGQSRGGEQFPPNGLLEAAPAPSVSPTRRNIFQEGHCNSHPTCVPARVESISVEKKKKSKTLICESILSSSNIIDAFHLFNLYEISRYNEHFSRKTK